MKRTWFVVWMTLATALQFYTFNENFAELTAVLVGGLVIGFAVADREARRQVLRMVGLTAIAYVGAIILSSPYLIYSLKHYQGNLQRQNPVYSVPLIRLIVPASDKMFGLTPLIRYSNHLGRIGIESYVGIPLIVVLLMLAVFAWRNRITRLLLIGFVFVITLAVGPHMVVTSARHTYTLPWAGLWSLPFARSAETVRFIVFGVLVLAVALALWLAAPAKGKLQLAARWSIGLLAAAVIITDSYTSYIDVHPVPPGYKTAAGMHPVNQLPAFIADGTYRRYLRPGEIVVILTGRGNAGMLFQAASGFYYRIAGGCINASLTPTYALPNQAVLLAHPSKAAIRKFDDYARSDGIGALVVEHTWALPWMRRLPKLGMHGISVGGVTTYPMAPWLASQARLARLAHRAHVAYLAHQALRPRRTPTGVASCGLLNVSRLESQERMTVICRSGFTFSDTKGKAPVGMGSQKLTTRQPSTPSVATLLVTPKRSGVIESTTRARLVSRETPATLAMPTRRTVRPGWPGGRTRPRSTTAKPRRAAS